MVFECRGLLIESARLENVSVRHSVHLGTAEWEILHRRDHIDDSGRIALFPEAICTARADVGWDVEKCARQVVGRVLLADGGARGENQLISRSRPIGSRTNVGGGAKPRLIIWPPQRGQRSFGELAITSTSEQVK